MAPMRRFVDDPGEAKGDPKGDDDERVIGGR